MKSTNNLFIISLLVTKTLQLFSNWILVMRLVSLHVRRVISSSKLWPYIWAYNSIVICILKVEISFGIQLPYWRSYLWITRDFICQKKRPTSKLKQFLLPPISIINQARLYKRWYAILQKIVRFWLLHI